jgi:hypothetical protein
MNRQINSRGRFVEPLAAALVVTKFKGIWSHFVVLIKYVLGKPASNSLTKIRFLLHHYRVDLAYLDVYG